MKDNEYQCANCKEIFEKGWSDEEAKKECEDHFGCCLQPDDPVVCDDCYKKIMDYNENPLTRMAVNYYNSWATKSKKNAKTK